MDVDVPTFQIKPNILIFYMLSCTGVTIKASIGATYSLQFSRFAQLTFPHIAQDQSSGLKSPPLFFAASSPSAMPTAAPAPLCRGFPEMSERRGYGTPPKDAMVRRTTFNKKQRHTAQTGKRRRTTILKSEDTCACACVLLPARLANAAPVDGKTRDLLVPHLVQEDRRAQHLLPHLSQGVPFLSGKSGQ